MVLEDVGGGGGQAPVDIVVTGYQQQLVAREPVAQRGQQLLVDPFPGQRIVLLAAGLGDVDGNGDQVRGARFVVAQVAGQRPQHRPTVPALDGGEVQVGEVEQAQGLVHGEGLVASETELWRLI